ncbi:ubiquitin-associated/TS-N domain-containing protein [Forsythia ovata]|uniref:Ubiquitin-associated/TS-N domain-containing protein n=1 Tax=Forsythia ovata TaxID=205694 RepID=A0ABD1TRR5_9LAMI
METSTVVVKVKHGDMLRRFNAQIVDEQLNFDMVGLRIKIFSLFNFAVDTLLTLTYIDEDGDEVTLVDDDDLRDVVRQALNPLRITVKHARSSGSSTPLILPRVQDPFQRLNPNISEILKSVPEPLQETVKKLLTELAPKAYLSAPGIAVLVDHFSEMGLSYLDKLSDSQPGAQSNGHSEVRKSTTDAKHRDSSKADPSISKVLPSIGLDERSLKSNESSAKYIPETTLEKNEVKLGNVKGDSMEASSSKAPEAVNVGVGIPCIDSLCESIGMDPEPSVVPVSSSSQEKISGADSTEKACLTPSNYPRGLQKPLKPRLDILRWKNVKLSAPTSYPAHTPWNHPDGSIRYVFRDGVWMDPSPVNESPFSAVPVGNDSAIPPHSASQRRSISQNDGTGSIFHRGVRCDGCGVYPITGPRFKSKVKEDYDLCSICFAEMGNDTDYIRMDRPMAYRHPLFFRGLHGRHARDLAATLPQVIRGGKVKPVAPKFDSRFTQDVNIIDGTVMAPLTPFTKIWRMRNNGTVVWPQRTQLVWIGGDKLNNALAIEVEVPAAGLPVDQELDVAVDFIAPEIPGRYISYWRMASPTGQKFGQRVWVLIQVDASIKEPPRESVRDLNLNLPPPSNSLTGPEIINVDSEPMVEDSHPEPDNSNDTMEVWEPMVDVQPGNEHEKRFPINDSLLVGSGASYAVPSAPPSSFSYPIIDLSEVAPPFPSQAPPVPAVLLPLANAHASSQPVSEKNEEEEKLLGALEAMGFKQVDLNKEILRENKYDLQLTVDDLCGVSEWDPILEELREMGFYDTELNKKLLQKNDGSIMRVVMDLIAGEQ